MVVTAAVPGPRIASRPATGWDTRVFVLCGDDRVDLRERVLSVLESVERLPDIALPDLAADLAAELKPGGVRLGVISGDVADLRAKLRRAADRLADPKCRQIRDATGVYFSAQPLYPQGSVALLFPGEGAQYPGMLLDLCGIFPEVEETFAWCDRLAAESGRPSLRTVIHSPREDSDSTEAELRKLGPAILGVLVADLAMIQVLRKLELPVSAAAGHSAGELAALMFGGAMGVRSRLGSELIKIMDLLEHQENEATGSDVALLAVGAGKSAVSEIAAAVAGGAVIVAMDNCPHQCVAVGPTHLVAAVESALHDRGLVCERLPFGRPYHTPLFEPWMGPLRDLFAGIPFEKPHTPIYSCTTGERFPEDAAAIRELAVNHWVSPVEFARMVEKMYADGVRVFVEAGPRGNLSAFVEDILRGKPFAAIPANLLRKSGPTQINHLAAQLAVHQVPLNLGHLFAGQTTSGSGERRKSVAGPKGQTPAARPPAHPVVHAPRSPAQIMDSYLGAMEQFIDVQREVMEAFLTGRTAPGAIPPEFLAFDDFAPTSDSLFVPHHSSPPEPFALVGEIVSFEPAREVVVRRVLDESEDRYAADHTLGGRGVSRVDPGQNGLPVLPMTFSLEAMAEAAALIAPGKVVTAIHNVRLFRWLPFDPEPTTLEVRASVAAVDAETGVVEVKVDVRDLGNSFVRDGANKPASEAVVILADAYPPPPETQAFSLTDEQPIKITVDDLRRNMFHGPLFQMVRSLDRIGKEGIEGTLEVQPRDGWFRSNPDPAIVLDPVLMDAAMHIFGAWHLEQPDWAGRILLPFEVKGIEFFGPPPAVGSRLAVRGHNEEESARHFRHGLEVYAPDGRLWLRMTGVGYWRFYLPFGHVNFFGPKDEYYLSANLPEAVAENVEPRTPGSPRLPFARCHFLEPPVDLLQPVLRAAGARVTMTPRELTEFHNWKGTDAELNDWFFGRLLAKDAVRAAWNEKHGEAMFPADIETEDVDGRIVCRARSEARSEPLPPVAVAIANGKVAAFAAFATRVGIAVVPVTKGEPEAEVRARAARFAAADALRVSSDDLAVEPSPRPGLLIVSHASDRLHVQTARHKDVIVATALYEPEQHE
ncbi:polyketide synthase dehydratase domain-containing protein [Fimbriiglobus ruber]|uniref:Malonyl CoA-acyl carrier protein transacylase n=1 Tax=Fimbriiglobus ruber TaxID=1908690 RepID=A0A225DLD9_9BACT|nr:polyketide synthase dehydratase domain-containing protein [Fimbriiglobus ruber]OWK39368.1 Malonyl CoA-acyl carrier protein transacylase [Fimbriiglobus ruber]